MPQSQSACVSKPIPKHCPLGVTVPTDQVVAGNAEIYGYELAPGRTYVFSQECRAAIYNWEGCTLEMSRPRPSALGSWADSTSVPPSYRKNCNRVCVRRNHNDLLRQPPLTSRTNARKSPCSESGAAPNPDGEASHYGVEPPRVLVVAPESSGKTTACKILTNYAVHGPTPAFPPIVNLDPGDVCPLVTRFSSTHAQCAGGWTLHVQLTRLFRPPHQLIHWESPQPLRSVMSSVVHWFGSQTCG